MIGFIACSNLLFYFELSKYFLATKLSNWNKHWKTSQQTIISLNIFLSHSVFSCLWNHHKYLSTDNQFLIFTIWVALYNWDFLNIPYSLFLAFLRKKVWLLHSVWRAISKNYNINWKWIFLLSYIWANNTRLGRQEPPGK